MYCLNLFEASIGWEKVVLAAITTKPLLLPKSWEYPVRPGSMYADSTAYCSASAATGLGRRERLKANTERMTTANAASSHLNT